ncbi:MAG: exodeoxyribonuclease VII large subunit [Gammaproteobacteria bacterium]
MSNQQTRQIFSVSELNRAVKQVLEENFGLVWIQGELSNLARPASGHIYFSLKDRGAQVRCAMFRAKNALVNFDLDNGVEVIARARVGMYEARGEYQLIVEHLEAAGDGLLRLKFEELKRKLAAEGLFDESNKYELPRYPRQIGIVTSDSGAALHDILTTLRRRNPAIPIIVYPTSVQGDSAKHDIVNALDIANQRDECDVLILARGGGSLEDLWSFNEEIVVRAIFDSEIPIVCGVGHEIDFTLADFTADVRAPTPTAAAELCAEPLSEMLGQLETSKLALIRSLQLLLRDYQQRLALYRSRLQHPGKRIEQLFQQCDELATRLPQALKNMLLLKSSLFDHLSSLLRSKSPTSRITQLDKDVRQCQQRLTASVTGTLERNKAVVAELSRTLNAVSPDATLSRGYAIISDQNNRIARDASRYHSGDELNARLAKGALRVTVKESKA